MYTAWGTTYLGIRVVVFEVPPLLGMGLRFIAAGSLLFLFLALRRGWRGLQVGWAEFGGAALTGALLLLIGNGLVAVAESRGLTSGVTSLLVATTPLFVVLYRSAARDVPPLLTFIGVAVGFAGLTYLLLAGTDELTGIAAGPALLAVVAAGSWSFGSWLQPYLRLPADAFVATGYQMLAGGGLLLLVGLALGERTWMGDWAPVTWLAWSYLVVFGSLVGFSAYVWLLAHAPISLVATYAYVNPVVAVVLGAVILGEVITGTIVIGGGIIVASVVIVISVERAAATQARLEAPAPPAPAGPSSVPPDETDSLHASSTT